MMKKIVAVFLSTALVLAMMPVTALAEDEILNGYCGDPNVNEGKNVSYELNVDTGQLTISGKGDMEDFGYNIYDGAPWVNRDVTSVYIGEGVTSVGSCAFCLKDRLKSVSIPSTVTRIGRSAFDSSGLESIDLPAGLTEIGRRAFVGTKLKTIDIPQGVKKLEPYTFDSCTELEKVQLHEGLEEIQSDAFLDCTSLKRICIPASVRSMDYLQPNPFIGCSSLLYVDVAAGSSYYCSEKGLLYSLDKTKLITCPGGKSGQITVPMTVTNATDAFRKCAKLQKIVIPEVESDVNLEGCEQLVSLGPIGSGSSVEIGLASDDDYPNVAIGYAPNIEIAVFPDGTNPANMVETPALRTVYFPKSVKNFNWMPSVTDVYYGGSEEDWGRIEKSYRENVPNATIHYNRLPGHLYIRKMDFGGLEVNSAGTATQWFEIQDYAGRPVSDCSIQYKEEGNDPVSAKSDENGLVGVTVEDVSDSKKIKVDFSSSDSSVQMEDSHQEFDVTAKKLSYSHEWEGAFSIDRELGAGFVPEGMKTDVLSVGAGLNQGGSLSVSDEYDNGKRTLSIGYGVSDAIEGAIKTGIKKELLNSGKINLFEYSKGVTSGSLTSYGAIIEGYSPSDWEQNQQVANVVIGGLATTLSHTQSLFGKGLCLSVVEAVLENLSEAETNTLSRSQSVSLSYGAKFGTFNIEGAKESLANFGSNTVYSHTETIDASNESEKTRTYTNAVVSSVGTGLGSPAFEIDLGGMKIGGGSGDYEFGLTQSNHKEISVTTGLDEPDVKSVAYKTYKQNDYSVAWGTDATNTYSTVTYTGDEAVEQFGNYSMLRRLINEPQPVLQVQQAINQMQQSGVKASVVETTQVTSARSVALSFDADSEVLGFDLGLSPVFSGEESYSWNGSTSTLYKGRDYPTTRSSVTQEEVEEKTNMNSLSKLLTKAVDGFFQGIASGIESVMGNVDTAVKNGNAVVKKGTEAATGSGLFVKVKKLASRSSKMECLIS